MFTLLIFATFTLNAIAAPICAPSRSQIQGPSEIAKYFDRLNIIGKPDRKSAKDFAKDNNSTASEIEKRYGASGDLSCGTNFSQAQVVLKSDLILTAAHSLFDGDCNSSFRLDQCKFATIENGKRKFYDLERIEGA